MRVYLTLKIKCMILTSSHKAEVNRFPILAAFIRTSFLVYIVVLYVLTCFHVEKLSHLKCYFVIIIYSVWNL